MSGLRWRSPRFLNGSSILERCCIKLDVRELDLFEESRLIVVLSSIAIWPADGTPCTGLILALAPGSKDVGVKFPHEVSLLVCSSRLDLELVDQYI